MDDEQSVRVGSQVSQVWETQQNARMSVVCVLVFVGVCLRVCVSVCLCVFVFCVVLGRVLVFGGFSDAASHIASAGWRSAGAAIVSGGPRSSRAVFQRTQCGSALWWVEGVS